MCEWPVDYMAGFGVEASFGGWLGWFGASGFRAGWVRAPGEGSGGVLGWATDQKLKKISDKIDQVSNQVGGLGSQIGRLEGVLGKIFNELREISETQKNPGGSP
jgi:hypothetical protein